MAILLAPMEGLLDFVLRDILTRIGGIDRCVSEFIRVTNTLLPERVFIRVVPELLTGGKTFSGVPVRAQLLGSDPICLAENADRLASLGPDGIDMNFGCPAKLVNRHGGGAALLNDPELLTRIMSAVRRAVPSEMPVSAKMRLGYMDDLNAVECAQALESGGAQELVVHARTKADGYRPPAYWERVADIRAAVRIPVVANGEIWTVEDAIRCKSISGCESLMIGRGAVTDPGLAKAIKRAFEFGFEESTGQALDTTISWELLLPMLRDFWQLVCSRLERRQQAGRFKQWLNFLRKRYPQAEVAYFGLRTFTDPAAIDSWFESQGILSQII